jgi:hypothetical protein
VKREEGTCEGNKVKHTAHFAFIFQQEDAEVDDVAHTHACVERMHAHA